MEKLEQELEFAKKVLALIEAEASRNDKGVLIGYWKIVAARTEAAIANAERYFKHEREAQKNGKR